MVWYSGSSMVWYSILWYSGCIKLEGGGSMWGIGKVLQPQVSGGLLHIDGDMAR